jgi:pimeloyl-ACP methyl ester carboxylesterase
MTSHINARPSELRLSRALLGAAAAAALFGCSGLDGSGMSSELEAERQVTATTLTPEDREAEFQEQAAGSLSEEEKLAVETALRESGLDLSEMAFAGRMVTFGDVYLDVDVVLRQLRDDGLAQKGRSLGLRSVTRLCTQSSDCVAGEEACLADEDGKRRCASLSTDGFAIAPQFFSSELNGSFFFERPDLLGMTVVVPDGASFLVDAFRQAGVDIADAADDCLGPGILVTTQSLFDDLGSEDQRIRKPIFVRYGAADEVCPNSEEADACALFPREETRDFEFGLGSTRLIPGPRIGLNSAVITSADPKIGVLTHELLHTLGLAHSNGGFETNVVPGSSCSSNVDSIMRSGGASASITSDDSATIDTLYSPLPGASCAYSRGQKVYGPVVAACR